MKRDKYEPRERLIDFVFEVGCFDVEGEPDDPKQVFVIDMFGDDRALKAAQINKRFFGGTATLIDYSTFDMTRLQCRDEKALKKAHKIFNKHLADGGWGEAWMPGGSEAVRFERREITEGG